MSIFSSIPFGKAVRAWGLICIVLAGLSVAAANWVDGYLNTDDTITGSITPRKPAVKEKRIIRSVLSPEPMVIEQTR